MQVKILWKITINRQKRGEMWKDRMETKISTRIM